MVRLYEEHANQIVELLMALRDRLPQAFEVKTHGQMPISGNELYDIIMEQLQQQSPPEKDLIEQIVKVLGLPFIENRLSMAAMKQLRNLLMLPSEIDAWVRMVHESWFCPGCGVEMHQGQMVTIEKGETGAKVFCTNCVPPRSVVCNNGKHLMPTTKRLMRAIQEIVTCGFCKSEKEAVKKKEPEDARRPAWMDWGGRGGTETLRDVPPAPRLPQPVRGGPLRAEQGPSVVGYHNTSTAGAITGAHPTVAPIPGDIVVDGRNVWDQLQRMNMEYPAVQPQQAQQPLYHVDVDDLDEGIERDDDR